METANLNPLGLESDPHRFMSMNLPVQASREGYGKTTFVFYMPRKEACFSSEEGDESTPENDNAVARDAARLLRNLAALFDAFAAGKIDHVYYPDAKVPV